MHRESFKHGEEVILVVTVTYGGTKAGKFLPCQHSGIPLLRQDLTKLSIPQPKKESIKIPAPGTVRFHWASTIGSVLNSSLELKLDPGNERAVMNKEQRALKDASITALELTYETPDYRPEEEQEVGGAYYGDREEPPEYHSRPPSYEPPSQPNQSFFGSFASEVPNRPLPEKPESFSPPSGPMTRTRSQLTGNQILGQTATQTHKKTRRGKGKGTITSNPYPNIPTAPAQTSIVRTRSQSRLHPAITSETTQPSASSSRKVSYVHPLPSKPGSVVPKYPKPQEPEYPPSPRTPPYSYPEHPFVNPEIQHQPTPPPEPFSPNMHAQELQRSLRNVQIPMCSPSLHPESSDSDVDIEQMLLKDDRELELLKDELGRVKTAKEVEARQAAAQMDQIARENGSLCRENVSLNNKLKELEQELERERSSRMNMFDEMAFPPTPPSSQKEVDRQEDTQHWVEIQRLQNELQEEREKRLEAERVVEGVRRECREPFTVPALLDAFLMIENASADLNKLGMSSSSSEISDEGMGTHLIDGMRTVGGHSLFEDEEMFKLQSSPDSKRKRGLSDDEDDLSEIDENYRGFKSSRLVQTRATPQKRYRPDIYVMTEWEHS